MNKNNNALQKRAWTGAAIIIGTAAAQAQYSPTPVYPGPYGKTVAESTESHPQYNPKAQKGAPNVVWVVLDDLAFGAIEPFGGLIETPTMKYLSEQGLRFNNFHTTSISAPSRAALLTGRNHHSSHVGMFNTDTYGAPGYDTYGPMENGTVAEILRENGYNTFAIGKYHFAPIVDASNAAAYNRWPTQRGFDHFYGFNAATAVDDQWHPSLYIDTQRDQNDSTKLLAITRFADAAINFIADQKTADPEKPFFLYFAPGTAHWPHQTTKEWIEKYRGRFDDGWDEYARRTLENQKRLGIVPKNTKLPIRNETWDKWNSLSADEKKVFARQMELFAGYVEQGDYEIGRIVDYLREIGQLDNTVIIVAVGDNGAEARGWNTGILKHDKADKDRAIKYLLEHHEEQGDESTYPFYAEGWAAATTTPFRYYKGNADYEGGTHDGLIVFDPRNVKDRGGIRTQYTHLIDLLPTTVELTGSKVPERINGYEQRPIEGTSFAYAVTSDDDNVEERHTQQYYELRGSYAIYKDGWKALFHHDATAKEGEPWVKKPQLYHIAKDFNESKDLAEKYPEKVAELEAVFEVEARKYNVYPLKTGREVKGRPYEGRRHFDIFLGTRGWAEFPGFAADTNADYELTAEVETKSEAEANGALFSFDNFSFYVKDGRLVYVSKTDIGSEKVETAAKVVGGGSYTLKAALHHDWQKRQTTVSLFVNNEKVAEKTLETLVTADFSNLTGPILQIGRSWGYPLSKDYTGHFVFKGKYRKAYIDLK